LVINKNYSSNALMETHSRLKQWLRSKGCGQSPNRVCVCIYKDMRRLTRGIRSEKCFVRRFRRRANVYVHKPW